MKARPQPVGHYPHSRAVRGYDECTRNTLERPSKGDGLSFLFVLVETRVGHRVSRGISPSADGDQVPPGRARLRAWTAPGLRPGPNFAHGAGFRFLYLPSIASIASITAERKPWCSSALTPLIVIPPGEQTASFIAPGWVPVSTCILPVPHSA